MAVEGEDVVAPEFTGLRKGRCPKALLEVQGRVEVEVGVELDVVVEDVAG